jgi:hypothetical protein
MEEHRSYLRQAAEYMRAEASTVTRGETASETREARVTACQGCDRRKDASGDLQDSLGFCGACGCSGKRAALSVKVTMPGANCPLGKWPAEVKVCGVAGPGEALHAARTAVSSVAMTVAEQLKKLRDLNSRAAGGNGQPPSA